MAPGKRAIRNCIFSNHSELDTWGRPEESSLRRLAPPRLGMVQREIRPEVARMRIN